MAFDKNTDYKTEIDNAMSSGGSSKYVQSLKDARDEKIKSDAGNLGKYNDQTYNNRVSEYINNQQIEDKFGKSLAGNGGGGGNEFLGRNAYLNDYQSQREKAMEMAIENSVKQLQNQIPGVQKQADGSRSNMYVTGLQSAKKNNSMLANMGLAGGGYSESSKINQLNNMQNNIGNVDMQEANTLNGINNNIANVRTTGEINLANLKAEGYKNMMEAMERASERARQDSRYDKEWDRDETRYGDSLAQQQWGNNMDWKQFENMLNQQTYQNDLNNQLFPFELEQARLGLTAQQIANALANKQMQNYR